MSEANSVTVTITCDGFSDKRPERKQLEIRKRKKFTKEGRKSGNRKKDEALRMKVGYCFYNEFFLTKREIKKKEYEQK